jgi:hypothetical protein
MTPGPAGSSRRAALTGPPKYITIAVDQGKPRPLPAGAPTAGPHMEEIAPHDLAISLDWEYDWDFVGLIEEACRALELRTLTISPATVAASLEEFRAGRVDFRILFDRAAGSSPEFLALQALALERGRDVIDPVGKLRWASDKATMHLEFISHGLHTPHTVILPSYETERDPGLRPEDLVPLGAPFIIKPANTTGGSLGVVENATGLEDALAARAAYPSDKYLLQEKVVPEKTDGKRFWFRGFYILGDVHCTWWDDRTHLYAELDAADVESHALEPLFSIVRTIAAISGLRFFSTEIVRDVRGKFLVVDYVNEICDMRLQSLHPDGVPDAVVRAIALRVASYAQTRRDLRPEEDLGR